MGVYIKGMSKPKECKKCKFYIVEAKVEGKIYPLNAYCFVQHQNIKDFTDCPLIEIDLVRCKECKRCEERTTLNGLPFLYCLKMEVSVGSDQYCYWGERGNDE